MALRSLIGRVVRLSVARPGNYLVRPAVTRASYQRYISFTPPRFDATASDYIPREMVSQRVLEVVKKFEKVEPNKVQTSSHFINDLGLDSLDTVELVMALEDEFAIEIPDADAEKILSCDDAIEYLSTNIHAK